MNVSGNTITWTTNMSATKAIRAKHRSRISTMNESDGFDGYLVLAIPKGTVAELEWAIRGLELYLQTRLKARDWHGVIDAAGDIREAEAKLAMMRKAVRR